MHATIPHTLIVSKKYALSKTFLLSGSYRSLI